MKLFAAVALALPALLPQDKPGRGAVDAPVKDFRLRDLTKDQETFISLSDFRDKKAVVLVFTSYTCTACEDYEGRIRKLPKDFEGKDVAVLGVRSSAEDDAAGMRKYAEEKGFRFPFLDDPGNVLADALGVAATPTFFVIDRKGVLRYRGSYDDAFFEDRATKTYVHDAVRALLEGREVPLKSTRAVGCHLPRVETGK
jgi:peroxiredoxin